MIAGSQARAQGRTRTERAFDSRQGDRDAFGIGIAPRKERERGPAFFEPLGAEPQAGHGRTQGDAFEFGAQEIDIVAACAVG